MFLLSEGDAVYTIPQQKYADEMSPSKKHAENSNDDNGNICETAEYTRNTSPEFTYPAQSVFCIENKDNMLSRDFTHRPSSPVAPINAPNRKGEMDGNEKQPLQLKKDEDVEAGPSALRPGGQKHVCDVCHKEFKQKSDFVRHYRIHTGGKPFVCDTCGRKFSRKEHLEIHLRTHTGEEALCL
ncbi:unnamed protein product [Larinioides sclopetarius]|uniref:C2H2-type domain-containing protein n=1 Tax=Larinioides sclopetarius TaxID=280406 RepID=A0AAV2BLJ3_9ARAC